VKRRAHYLDKGFHLCGLRFGWTFFISLIPVVGDCVDAVLNYTLVVRKARQADIPQWLLSRMMLNNAVSFGVSFIPLVGDVFLAAYKANSRNAALLEEFLRVRGEEFLRLHPSGEVDVNVKKGFGSFFKKKSTAGGSGATGEASGSGSQSKAKHATASDLEQIKPGSGLKPGEVPTINTEFLDEEEAAGSSQQVGPGALSPPVEGSAGNKSFGSFFGKGSSRGGSRKSSPTGSHTRDPELNPPYDRQSRFIENVSASSAAPSTT